MKIPPLAPEEISDRGRRMSGIARQPAFIVALLCGIVAYGVMNLLMTATPLAMIACDHAFNDPAFVIQWHLVAMFAPSFFTGTLIKRVGLLPIMGTGAVLLSACSALALTGISVAHFWIALVVLGVGWNFMYIGATTLLTETHTPAERGKVQGVNDMAIFGATVLSSLSAGALLSYRGWQLTNPFALAFVALAAAALIWVAVVRKPPDVAPRSR